MFSHLHVCNGFTTGFDGGDVGCGGGDSTPVDGGEGTSPTIEPQAPGHAPRIENLHKIIQDYVKAEEVEGEKPKFVAGAVVSPYFPWASLAELVVCVFAIHTRQSRKSLQLLLDLLHLEDSQGNRFDPRDAPQSAEHLISRARERLPLLRLVRRKVEGKGDQEAQTVECPLNLVFHRMLQCPRIVEEFLKNPAGKQMSEAECIYNRVPDRHITPIATREVDGSRQTFMHGDMMASSAHMGLECVTSADGVRLMVGDTAVVKVEAFGPTVPCRIASMFWQEKRKPKCRGLQLANGWRGLQRSQTLEVVAAEDGST